MTRRVIVTLLVGLNLSLAAALWFSAPRMPRAFAQAGIQAGGYLTVTARSQAHDSDIVWVLDLAEHKLFAFYPASASQLQLVPSEPRELLADFGKVQP